MSIDFDEEFDLLALSLRTSMVLTPGPPCFISRDCKTLAKRSKFGGDELRLWDVTTGSERPLIRVDGLIERCFTPDGKTLITIDGALLRSWDVRTGKERFSMKKPPLDDSMWHGFMRRAMSPDGKILAISSYPREDALMMASARDSGEQDANLGL